LRPRDFAELLALAALWGASFLFMRIAAPAFGPVVLAALRVAGAALLLVPLLAARGQMPELGRHWRAIAIVGLVNSALPFLCFAYAALSINAGLSAIFNSATPLFAAMIAWSWLADRMTPARVLGLAIEAVNLGYGVVVPRDTVAGIPQEYADAVLDNTFPLISTLTTVDELLGAWETVPARPGANIR